MKRSEQRVTHTINVTAQAAWEVIGQVDGVENWFAPMITNSRIEGDNRICSTADGDFTEDILNVDHENRVFEYGIPKQHMMPVENIKGVMKVFEAGENQATIEWSWSFDVEEEKEAEAQEMLAGAGQMGISGIEKFVLSNN